VIEHLLVEHTPSFLDLPVAVVDELHRSHARHISASYGGAQDRWEIRPSSFVGSLTVGEHRFRIQPKAGIRNVLAMMDVQVSSEQWSNDVTPQGSDPDFLAVMARVMCLASEETTRRGVRRDYVSRQERLVSPRGRIDIAEIVRRPGLETPVPCRFDEHTVDVPLNRLIRAALERARRVPAIGPGWQRRLMVQLGELEDASGPLGDIDWVLRWDPGPMERHYESAVRLAHLILLAVSLNSKVGETTASSFLVDMNALFEAWVGRRLRDALPDLEVIEQHSTHLDTSSQIALRPDLVIRSAGREIAVADCKYKLLEGGEARSADYYQALAYATALGLPEAWLIYARLPGQPEMNSVTVRHSGVQLRTFALDLSQGIDDAVNQLNSFGTLAVAEKLVAQS